MVLSAIKSFDGLELDRGEGFEMGGEGALVFVPSVEAEAPRCPSRNSSSKSGAK